MEEHNITVARAVKKYGMDGSLLIPILHEIQKEYRYLPEQALREISSIMDISLVDIYGVATFFTSFSLKPKGKHIVTVCMGTACHVRNATSVAEEVGRVLGISPSETTRDMLFSLETVNCLGACALGPIVVIDGKYHGEMTATKVKRVLKKIVKSEGIEG